MFSRRAANLQTFNFTPSAAYKINDMLSVGVGVQVQYAHASFTQGLPGGPPGFGLTNQAGLSGSGMGFGWTAGATLTPLPGTTIGLGYRSGIDQKINGTLVLPAGAVFSPPFSTPGSINTSFRIPGILSLGLQQKLTQQWTALGTVEWTNWSRIGTSNVLQPNGSPALVGLNRGQNSLRMEGRLVFLARRRISVEPAARVARRRRFRKIAGHRTRSVVRRSRTTTAPGYRLAAPIDTTPRSPSISPIRMAS